MTDEKQIRQNEENKYLYSLISLFHLEHDTFKAYQVLMARLFPSIGGKFFMVAVAYEKQMDQI